MTVSSSVDEQRDLTIFTVKGELTFDDAMAALQGVYQNTPTTNILWDLRKIGGSRMTGEELHRLITFVKGQKSERPTGRTALVAPLDVNFGLSRMVEAYGQGEDLPWEIRAFRSMDEAFGWIDEKPEAPLR